MGRKPGRLNWMKFYIDDILDGTTNRELTAAERGVWFELLLLAGRSNNHGRLKAADNDIPRLLNVPKPLFVATITKCLSRAIAKLRRGRDGHLIVVNYDKYQPDKWWNQAEEAARKERKTGLSRKSRKSRTYDLIRPEEKREDKDKEEKREDARVHARGLPPSRKDVFEDFPYSHSPAMRDENYKKIRLIKIEQINDDRKLTPEEGRLVDVAIVWAHYTAKCPYGTKFNTSEDTIRGYLADGLTVKELRDEAKEWKGSKSALIWEVFGSLKKKAEHRRVSQENTRKASAAREKQKAQRAEEARIEKEDRDEIEKWKKEHRGEKFPGRLSPEFMKWQHPETSDEDIENVGKIFPQRRKE